MKRYDLISPDPPLVGPGFLRLSETAMLLSLLEKGLLTRHQFERCLVLRKLYKPDRR